MLDYFGEPSIVSEFFLVGIWEIWERAQCTYRPNLSGNIYRRVYRWLLIRLPPSTLRLNVFPSPCIVYSNISSVLHQNSNVNALTL